MSSLAISAIVLGCILAGVGVGGLIRRRLPDEHLGPESKEVVKLGLGLVGTMAALVLGLLVASAKESFDTQRTGVFQLAANVILLDRTLAHFGKDADGVRAGLKVATEDVLRSTWPHEYTGAEGGGTEGKHEDLFEQIVSLPARTDAQRALLAQAQKTAIDIGQTRWLLYTQKGSSIPLPLLGVMVFWLVVLHAGFGLLSPGNRTATAALLVSALAVSTAVFLVLELDRPFRGVIEISSAPMRNALSLMGK